MDKTECIKHSCQGHVHLLKDCTRKKFNLQFNSTFWVIIYSVSFTVTVAERKCSFRMVSKCFDALYSADTAKHIYAFLLSNDAAKKLNINIKGTFKMHIRTKIITHMNAGFKITSKPKGKFTSSIELWVFLYIYFLTVYVPLTFPTCHLV